ncbi:MAG: prepilin peptidase [Candidatus Paceibacterota bacterium]
MYFLLFILGLAVGSFLNVISLRYAPGNRILDLKIISGRSKCLNCKKTLSWYELIPILSFIIQKGRCRSCDKRFFWQYPLIEMLSGFIFVFIPWHLNNFQFLISNFQSITNYQLLISIIWIVIFLLFLLLSIIDFRQYIIPNQINLSLAFLGVVLIILNSQFSILNSFLGHYTSLFSFTENIWLSHFVAALFGIAIFWLIIFLSKGKAMGWGDLKLVGALGLTFGWPDIIMVLMLSFLVGGIFSAILLIKGKKKMKDVVSFGPFLIIGATLTFFFGYQIISAYFKLFNL